MVTCGLCGSGITADEKFKRLKDGTTNRYVYYGYAKFKDKNCPCRCIRKEDLIKQLVNILDTVSLDKIGMKDQEFQESVLGQTVQESIKIKEIDIRNYAKHILRKRSIWEKHEILSHLRSKLALNGKIISLVS